MQIDRDGVEGGETSLFYTKNGCQVFPLHGRWRTLSTSPLNGGIRTDLQFLLNINCLGGAYECVMLEDTYEKELMRQAAECGVDPACTTALSTAAWTELSAVRSCSFGELTVQTVVSGGIDHNATAPGDPAGYYEEDGRFFTIQNSETKAAADVQTAEAPAPGTLNIFLFINRELTEAAMLRALMICAEAKESAVRELLLGSCYSTALASGSGTDGCIIASQMNTGAVLTDASGHSKLGELIGTAVREAVKAALLNQTGANGARQFHMLQRVKRFGITQGSLYDFYKDHEELYQKLGICFPGAGAFDDRLHQLEQNSNLVLAVSLYVHLMDQCSWGLIMPGEVLREGTRLLQQMLYVSPGVFLQDAYGQGAFDMSRFTEQGEGADPAAVLMHHVLLWMGKAA